MLWLGFGAGTLLLALVLLRVFAAASVSQVRLALLWAAGLLLAAAVGAAVLLGRGGQVLGGLVLFGPLLWRWWRGRRLAARFGAAPGGGDAVRTATLEMRLDPATGSWTGTVLRGPAEGRDLGTMGLDEVRALLRECGDEDAESVPLLEAWLDRAHPGWREAGRGDAGTMSRDEALAVLGLDGDADEDAVRAAYTRLMRAAHPDAGGSDWLAARLNEARDTLLRP